MIRLHVTAEGWTEQAFVKQLLAPHLAQYGVYADARCVLTSKDKRAAREYRGGLSSYEKAKADILTWIKEDEHQECRFTTMFDLYALPGDFPGHAEAVRKEDPYARVEILEQSMARDISEALNVQNPLIPYIQLHEFEALVFVDPQKLDREYLEHQEPIDRLISMVGKGNPELINDGPETAPSKRILAEIPEYNKTTAGVSVVEQIGVEMLREKCSHFDDWLSRLEALGGEGGIFR